MTDAERLEQIERGIPAGDGGTGIDVDDLRWLVATARKASQDLASIRQIIPTFIQDRAADEDWLVGRDVVLRDEVAKLVAAECKAAVEARLLLHAGEIIARHFGLSDASTPTLSARVAAECAELAERERAEFITGDAQYAATQIAEAIRSRFGLASPEPAMLHVEADQPPPSGPLNITPANVIAGENAVIRHGFAGERIQAGEALVGPTGGGVYFIATDPAIVDGIALCGAEVGQPIMVQESGSIHLGGPGTPAYVLPFNPAPEYPPIPPDARCVHCRRVAADHPNEGCASGGVFEPF